MATQLTIAVRIELVSKVTKFDLEIIHCKNFRR